MPKNDTGKALLHSLWGAILMGTLIIFITYPQQGAYFYFSIAFYVICFVLWLLHLLCLANKFGFTNNQDVLTFTTGVGIGSAIVCAFFYGLSNFIQ
jgi:hypothetical protein